MWGLDTDVSGCLDPEDLIDITKMETEYVGAINEILEKVN